MAVLSGQQKFVNWRLCRYCNFIDDVIIEQWQVSFEEEGS